MYGVQNFTKSRCKVASTLDRAILACETILRVLTNFEQNKKTMPPCYRKGDRAMALYNGCPENLWVSLATFPEIVNGLMLTSIILKCVQNLKFVALPFMR